MGIFGDDERQDERLDALEHHVRSLTDAVQQTQLDLAAGQIMLLALQAQVDQKISTAEVDPSLLDLNKDLASARQQIDEASKAAEDSWAALQKGAQESVAILRESIDKAAKKQEATKQAGSAG